MKFQLSTRGIVFSACFGALYVISSFLNIHLGFSPVPITLQNFVVMLAGAILGPWYGFFSIGLVIGLTALGLPLIHGSGGLSLILGPTGGFLWAFPFAALFIGFFSRRIKGLGVGNTIAMFLVMEIFGSLLVYVSGVPWLAHTAHIPLHKALLLGCYPFLPGDAVKAFLAASAALTVRTVFPLERITGRISESV